MENEKFKIECDQESFDFITERLFSKNNEIIYDTIIQIKNLIIGNNKYKSYYLKDKLINRLLDLINDYYLNYLITIIDDFKTPNSNLNKTNKTTILFANQFIDLINQILIILGSFCLGNLEHVSRLIKKYNLHGILFNLIRLNAIYFDLNPSCPKQGLNLKLVESCLRTLSNLYTSSQILPLLIHSLDKPLYLVDGDKNSLSSLTKLFHLSNTTKQTILNIITISSTNLMISTTVRSSRQSPSLDLVYLKNRSMLIKLDFIRLFSGLLTSLNPKIQLNCLKFYSSICFEGLEATRLILNTNFYDYSLLELISSYLSRENSSDLQLYAAKCLTNLCRSSLIFKNELEGECMEVDSNEFKAIDFESQLIKLKTLPTLIRLCSTYSVLYRNSSSCQPLNSLLLIEAISTLSYLIELSSDLQQTASSLEQIIHILILNILNGYSYLNGLGSSSNSISYLSLGTEFLSLNKTPCTSLFSLFYLYYNHFVLKCVQFKQNEQQYRFGQFSSVKMENSKHVAKSMEFFVDLDPNLHRRLISVCFQSLSCLASNSEESRRLISSNPELLSRLIDSIQVKEKCEISDDIDFLDEGLVDEKDDFEDFIGYSDEGEMNIDLCTSSSDATLLRISSMCLLHSLSRSVHQLRTRFLDSKLWSSIIYLIKRLKSKKSPHSMEDLTHENEDNLSLNEKNLISILIAILANLLIEFSPCKETLIKDDIVKILIDFIDYKNKSIRVNSIWALMNLAYHSEQKIKLQILTDIKIDRLFQLLTEQDEILVIKTLGLIRNLICSKSHIDFMMCFYGNKIIQAIIMILEGEFTDKMIKEQALCILANIAAGYSSKEFIMGNEDLLRKINSFMTHSLVELQRAAVYCVANLVNISDKGAQERQLKLKEIGAHKILQKLLHSNDAILFDKVKIALQQFSTTVNTDTLATNEIVTT